MRNHHEELLQVVRSVRNRWRLRVLLRGGAILLLVGVALVLVAGYVIDAMRFDDTAVTAVRLVSYLILLLALLRWVVWPLLRRVPDERVALYLEEHEPALGGCLLSAVELGREAPAASSSALVEQLVRSAVEECHLVDDGKRVDHRKLWQSSGLMAGSTACGLALFLIGPAFLFNTTPVLLAPWEKSEVHNPYSILVEPGDTVLVKGADLEVRAVLQGFDSSDVDLVVRTTDEWERWPMVSEPSVEGASTGYSLIVFELEAATEYFVEASGVSSPVYRVDVRELPYVEEIHLTYHFPSYTGLDPVEQEGSGDIAALVGTQVRLGITSTLPVAGGALELEGEDGSTETFPLAVREDGSLSGELRVTSAGLYRVLLDSISPSGSPEGDSLRADGSAGERVVASPDYLIDPLPDQPPTLVVQKPGRDLRVTNLEEVAVQLRAQDDYGVREVELVYSVNGGDEEVATLYRRHPGRKDFVGTRTLYLEEFEQDDGNLLAPGDLVAYYARARDGFEGHGVEKGQETVSDIYFMQIRPFDQNYRQADQGGMPGQQQGMQSGELSEQQRMIISATFKLAKGRLEATRDELSTVALSQGSLRETVLSTVQQMTMMGAMGGSNSPVGVMLEALPLAAEAMTKAEEALGEHRSGDALAPEQKALQYLQRADAAFRDIQVAQQQGGGGGGGQGELNEQLSDLFEMERDQLRNQYEQVQRSQQQTVDNAIDETLERLRELARRQQQENERMRARAQQAGQQNRAGSSGRSQRQLAEEAEEIARQLERLSREESLPELAETARRLREAAERMRRAAAAGEQSGEAMGQAALDQLGEARRQLDRNKSGRLARDTQQALERTRRLREQQERMGQRVERLDLGDPDYLGDLEAIRAGKEQMGAEVGGLEADIDQLSRDFRREQPEASRRLQDAVDEIRDNKIREKILYSRGVVEQRSKGYARNFEENIAGGLEELEKQLEAAAGSIGQSREQRLEEALEETREVVTALESLEDRLQAGEQGSPGEQGSSGEEGNSGEQGNPGEQRGGGERAGERLFEGGGATGSAALRPQDYRQLARELGERRIQLEALRAQLEGEGVDTAELDGIIQQMRELTPEARLADISAIPILERQIVQGLKEFEYSLRRSLGAFENEQVLQVADEEVPDGYEEMVERYYKALAGGEE